MADNFFNNAWANIANAVWSGISFADDVKRKAIWFWWELAAKAATLPAKALLWVLDIGGDVLAGTTDFVSGGLHAATGWAIDKTDYMWKEWVIDKLNTEAQKWFKSWEDATKSDWGKTKVWWAISEWAGWLGEMLIPFGIVNKWAKWLKMAKDARKIFKESPKAIEELKALAQAAKAEKRVASAEEVNAILSKYGVNTAKNVSEWFAKWAGKEITWQWSKTFIDKVSQFTPEEVASKHPRLTKALGKMGIDAWTPGKTLTAEVLRQVLNGPDGDDVANEINSVDQETQSNIDNGSWISLPPVDAPSTDTTNTTKPVDSSEKKDRENILNYYEDKNKWKLNMKASVVDLMKGIGVESKQEMRKLIYEDLMKKPYSASAENNIELAQIIRERFTSGEDIKKYIESLKK